MSISYLNIAEILRRVYVFCALRMIKEIRG